MVIRQLGQFSWTNIKLVSGPKATSTYNGYPVYCALTGKIINQPEEMNDVRGLVSSDYQDVLEKQWLEDLHKRFKVEINKKVLNQVKEKYKM